MAGMLVLVVADKPKWVAKGRCAVQRDLLLVEETRLVVVEVVAADKVARVLIEEVSLKLEMARTPIEVGELAGVAPGSTFEELA